MASLNSSSTLNNDSYPRYEHNSYGGRNFGPSSNLDSRDGTTYMSPRSRPLSDIDEEFPPGFVPQSLGGPEAVSLDTRIPNLNYVCL